MDKGKEIQNEDLIYFDGRCPQSGAKSEDFWCDVFSFFAFPSPKVSPHKVNWSVCMCVHIIGIPVEAARDECYVVRQ